ncbi:D-aminoacyl-tRNA deacylase [soil metagenome]
MIDDLVTANIGQGLLIFLGVEEADNLEDVAWLAGKISKLRIFSDVDGKMNADIVNIDGRFLVVSQFTLHANTRKGNRPSFIRAARPDVAIPLYEAFLLQLEKESGRAVRSGRFGADMKVSLLNDGPVTIWMDSKTRE